MNEYEVVVVRDGKWWMVQIPALDGLTQARRLGEVEKMARDYVAVSRGIPTDDVVVRVTRIDVDGVDVAARVAEISRERDAAEEARQRVADETRRLARELSGKKVPVRDIGALLDVSHQRAHQLVG